MTKHKTAKRAALKRARKSQVPLPQLYRALMLAHTGETWPIEFRYVGPEGLAAQLYRYVGGPPAIIRIADDSGGWLVVNKQAELLALPQNVSASFMADQCVRGHCVVCPPAKA